MIFLSITLKWYDDNKVWKDGFNFVKSTYPEILF